MLQCSSSILHSKILSELALFHVFDEFTTVQRLISVYSINGLIDNLSAFHARFRALTGIEKGFEQAAREHTLMDDARVQDLKAWVRGRSIDALQTMKTVIRDDGISMVDLARKEPETIKLSE